MQWCNGSENQSLDGAAPLQLAHAVHHETWRSTHALLLVLPASTALQLVMQSACMQRLSAHNCPESNPEFARVAAYARC